MEDYKNTVIHADCLEVMKQIPDDYFDVIVADPPYFEVRGAFDYQYDSFEHYLDFIEQCGKEIYRILKRNGSFFIFGDRRNIAYMQVRLDKYFNLINPLVWHKPNTISKKNLYNLKSFPHTTERILFYDKYDDTAIDNYPACRAYVKQLREYIGLSIKEINKALGHERADHFCRYNNPTWYLCKPEVYQDLINNLGIKQCSSYIDYQELNAIYMQEHDLYNRYYKPLPDIYDVITLPIVNYQDNTLHPTTKPTELIKILLKATCKPNAKVFDPFAGSGTTLVVAKSLGLEYLGCEISEEYVNITNKRLSSVQLDLFGIE